MQFTDQGIRNVKDTTKRAVAATEAAAQMGAKFKEVYWTLGGYDGVIVAEAPDDETITALSLRIASLGNIRTQTLRAFQAGEVEAILKRIG